MTRDEAHPVDAGALTSEALTDASRMSAGVRNGERGAIARAISALAQEKPSALPLLACLQPHRGRAHVAGITGPPGSGKSTFVAATIRELVAQRLRVSVAAVDPSSPITGGSILGDRIRTTDAEVSDAVYIRSLPADGMLGGTTRAIADIVDVLDAARFDVVIVETVAVGQSEAAVTNVADTCIVLTPPGLGDEVQAIKAGVLELADMIVVTKGDHPLAARAARDMRDMIALRVAQGGHSILVKEVTATSGNDVAALVHEMLEHGRRSGVGTRLRRAGEQANERRHDRDDPYLHAQGIHAVDGWSALRMPITNAHLGADGAWHEIAILALAICTMQRYSARTGSRAIVPVDYVRSSAITERGDALLATLAGDERGTAVVEVTNVRGELVARATWHAHARNSESTTKFPERIP